MNTLKRKEGSRGFTLLELLIVIGIIAILSVILIIVINPAETLKKSRDAQRISDLSTMKTALGIYTTSTTSPQLAGTSNTACKPGAAWTANTQFIYYSLPTESGTITDTTLDGGTTYPLKQQVAALNAPLTDGTGWLPVNFNSLTSGSPISNLPVDPVNNVPAAGILAAMDNTALVYRYACKTDLTYEIDAVLESSEYTSGTNNKLATDGGNNAAYYEVGTNLSILGTASNF